MENVLIRRLKREDADDIGRIESAITREPGSLDAKRIVEEQVERTGGASFVAELKGRVVGYMISYIISGNFGVDRSAWISFFGVDPQYMGQGIGMKLAERIFEVYQEQDITNVFTSVRWDSTDLLSFFKTLGFERSDFIHLRKELA